MEVNENEFLKNMGELLPESDIRTRMLKRREIFLWGTVEDESARIIVQKILYFDGLNTEDIVLYINSPGGLISSGLAIYDAMQFAKSDIRTVCMGQAASMGAVLLCAGAAGKRLTWPNSRILIHQPLISGNMYGPASDIQIQAEEMLRIKDTLNRILARHTGQPLEKIDHDTDRDYFMTAEEAMKYGIVDQIATSA